MAMTLPQKVEGYIICNFCMIIRFIDFCQHITLRLPLDNDCAFEVFGREAEFEEIQRACNLDKSGY